MTSCSPNTAFNATIGEPNVGVTLYSHTSTAAISPTLNAFEGSWVIQGFNLGPQDCLLIEYALGCGEGTLFSPLQASCGCQVKLCQDNNTIVLPYSGRYRLVATNTDSLGDFTVIARPTTSAIPTGACNMACGCNEAGHVPATIISPDGVTTVTASGTDNQTFVLDFQPLPAVGEIVASPAAVSLLCTALTPCMGALIPDPITVVPDDAYITVVPTATGYAVGFNEALLPVPVAVSANAGNVIVTGTDGGALLTSCMVFDGTLADPRPNVNPGMRVVGINTADPACPDVKFEVAQRSDIEGTGVAGQEPSPQKLLTVDSISRELRLDDTNQIYGVGTDAAANSTGIAVSAGGTSAAYQNAGSNVSAYGWYAAYNNTGSAVSAGGYGAARDNTGSAVSAYGHAAAYNNTGSDVSAYGHAAAYQNAGSNVSAYGHAAAYQNAGSNVSAYGWYAAYNNTGSAVSAGGTSAARDNTGSDVSAYGHAAAYQNAGSTVGAFGRFAAYANTGSDVVAVGYYAGWRNKNDNNDFFGSYAGDGPFLENITVTVTAATATTVTIAPATASPIGSFVTLTVAASSIANFSFMSRSFVVTTANTLTLVASPNDGGLGLTGTAVGAGLVRIDGWNNSSYFGRSAIGTGPNQAVLGGPSQTPCGWAPFTVISDAKHKLIDEKYDTSKRGLAVLENVEPKAFRLNPEPRYTTTEIVKETIEEEVIVGEAGNSGQPKTEKVKRVIQRPVTTTIKNDGSRADTRVTFGFIAQNVAAAADKAGVPANSSGVIDTAEDGGDGTLILDTNALLADAVMAIKQLSAKIKELEARLTKAGA